MAMLSLSILIHFHFQSVNIFFSVLHIHMDVSKTLKEHLQRQQEPFSLQDYIIERSYLFNKCKSDNSSAKHLKYDDIHKIRKRFLHATGILRTLLYKFIPSDWDDEHHSHSGDKKQTDDELFSLKSLTAPDYYTKSQVEDVFQTFTTSELHIAYEPYRISRMSLPNAETSLESQLPNSPPELVRDSLFSTYLRKLLLNPNILKLRPARKHKLEDAVDKRERFQLPLEFYLQQDQGRSLSIQADSDDILSVKDQHLSFFGKQWRKVNSISDLFYTECCVTSQEWNMFQIVHSGEIQMEIGDAILYDIISETINLF
ncbi:uncharacterized protein LOC107643291 isoform X2 [Arachis ipaensis]|uniref:uncharacterized protein LOC107643291 isoform X2 n=1 Tax=Arachis ipaensis TaxID=130454 RepID=UPI000A2B07BC|nr:uncharacterized protein LOC107643291 isoform X2 [Arachis ipaensis]